MTSKRMTLGFHEHTPTQFTNTMNTLLRSNSRPPSLCIYIFVLHLQIQENFTTWNTTPERYRSKPVSSALLIQGSRETYNRRRSHTRTLDLKFQLTSYSSSEWSSDRQRKQAREPTYGRKACYWCTSAKSSYAFQVLPTDGKSWRSPSSRTPVFVSSALLTEEYTRDFQALETPSVHEFSCVCNVVLFYRDSATAVTMNPDGSNFYLLLPCCWCSCTALAVALVPGAAPALAVVVLFGLMLLHLRLLVFVILAAAALSVVGLLQAVSKHGPRRSTCVQMFEMFKHGETHVEWVRSETPPDPDRIQVSPCICRIARPNL